MFQRLAVSLPANDSIKQEIKCCSWKLSQFPNHFSLNCQKAEHFSKNLIKKKLNMVSCQYDQTIKNVDADKGS